MSGRLACGRMLYEAGAVFGEHPDELVLHTTIEQRDTKCAELLLRGAISLEFQDPHTVLYLACQKGYADCAAVLIEAGTEVEAPLDRGPGPLHVAVSN